MMNPEKTQFGFTQTDDKPRLVDGVFASVASKYDVMNDLMSGGTHRLWKRRFVSMIAPCADKTYLDVAGGTGDIARRLVRSGAGKVTVCDPSAEMMEQGRAKSIDGGFTGIQWLQGRAEALPIEDSSIDTITISFGLRNVAEIDTALCEFKRVLKTGGRLWILEFTPVETPIIKQFYDLYSFKVLPRLGGLIARDRDSYQYLAESIRAFPDKETLAERMRDAGFSNVTYSTMNAGIVAVHNGMKVQ